MQDVKDVIIVGAGIIGLATAYKLLKLKPDCKILVIDKEREVATHQSGHNSGVIHTGIYYKPGSLKALNCVNGARQMHKFCQRENIPVNQCGKLIVATKEQEIPRLNELYQRGIANGVKELRLISSDEIKEIEPLVTHAKQAILSPTTAIVDFQKVALAIKRNIASQGVVVKTDTKFLSATTEQNCLIVHTDKSDFQCKTLINCAGVYADDVARASKMQFKDMIIPFRGEYYQLKRELCSQVKGLVYPVPDPQFPFLGVHLTRMINGDVKLGPNAVLALSKEGYSHKDVDLGFVKQLLSFSGFWKMSTRYWKVGMYELYRSLRRKEFLRSLQELAPQLTDNDIEMSGSGIRSQLVTPEGVLSDDFCIVKAQRMVHVLNAPSPGATSCFAIADHIVENL